MQPLMEGMEMDDISQWLRHGWFFVRDEDELKVMKFEGIMDPEHVYAFDPAKQMAANVHMSAIFTHWPRCGAVNMGGAALYVQRHQARQWRRTYSSRGVTISIPNRWELLGRVPDHLSALSGDEPVIVQSLFDPKYPGTVQEALRSLDTAPTVALNTQVMFVSENMGVGVYYRNENVGEYTLGTFRPNCDNLTARRVNKLIGGNL